jgi:hypothetical protein
LLLCRFHTLKIFQFELMLCYSVGVVNGDVHESGVNRAIEFVRMV